MGSMGGGSMGPPPPAPGGLPCDPAMCIPMFPGDAAMCHMPMCMGCADCMAPPHPPPHHGPPPCAMTCPMHMPTCAEFHQYVGPGGCASTCPDDLKTEGHIMFCEDEHGGPPPCAATCPRHHPSCDEFRGMIAPGGCGSTCSDELKSEYEAMLCPAAPPPPGSGPICGDGCCDNGSDPLAVTCPMMGGEDYYNCPADCAPPPPGSMGPPPPGSMGSMSGMGSMGSMGGGSMGPPPPAHGICDPAMCIPMFPGDAAMCHMAMCLGCADCMAPPPHPPPHHGPAPAHPPPHHGPICGDGCCDNGSDPLA